MNSDLLRTFLEVAKTRHFGHAADNLFLTQSAVSSRIKQLEQILGVPLFTRQRNNILLTPAGERLLPHAEAILVSWQLALQEAGVPGNQSMQLALGGTSNLWDTFLQSVLPSLATCFPQLYIRTEIDSTQGLIRALLGRRLDIAVLLDCPNNSELDSRRVGSLELIIVTDREGATIKDVPAIGHVFVDWGTALNLQQARLFDEPVAPILHTGQSHIALHYLLSHGGAGFLPKTLVEPYLDRGQLHRVAQSETVSEDIYLVFTRDTEKLAQLTPIIAMLERLEVQPPIAVDESF